MEPPNHIGISHASNSFLVHWFYFLYRFGPTSLLTILLKRTWLPGQEQIDSHVPASINPNICAYAFHPLWDSCAPHILDWTSQRRFVRKRTSPFVSVVLFLFLLFFLVYPLVLLLPFPFFRSSPPSFPTNLPSQLSIANRFSSFSAPLR